MSSPERPAGPRADALAREAERELRRHFDPQDPRLVHSLAVAACAGALAPAVPPDQRGLLVAAALLHDLGYAADVRVTGFHPVDGARYLRRAGWPEELCALVAHHSGARYVAGARGDAELLDGPDGFAFVEGPLTDALTAADQTIGPDGTALRVEERMSEMLQRHGPDSPQAQAHPRRAPYLRAAVARVEDRLEHADHAGHAGHSDHAGHTGHTGDAGQGTDAETAPSARPLPRREPAR